MAACRRAGHRRVPCRRMARPACSAHPRTRCTSRAPVCRRRSSVHRRNIAAKQTNLIILYSTSKRTKSAVESEGNQRRLKQRKAHRHAARFCRRESSLSSRRKAPVLHTPGTGNTGTCLRPRRVPESGNLGRSASSSCSSSRTRFWHNWSMPLSRRVASFGKAMAAPRPRWLGLHRLRHRSPPRLPRRVTVLLWRTMCMWLQVWLHRHRQPRPRHRPRRTLAWLPRPRMQHPPLSASSTSAEGLLIHLKPIYIF
jgi:hypothetical protein